MVCQIPADSADKCVLVVAFGAVAWNPRDAQFIENGRNVLVLELDRVMGAADARHQQRAVPRLHIGSAPEFVHEHVEVVGDDVVKLIILPIGPKFLRISHLSFGGRRRAYADGKFLETQAKARVHLRDLAPPRGSSLLAGSTVPPHSPTPTHLPAKCRRRTIAVGGTSIWMGPEERITALTKSVSCTELSGRRVRFPKC